MRFPGNPLGEPRWFGRRRWTLLENRKSDHVRIAIESGQSSAPRPISFDQVHLINDPLSDISADDVDLSTEFLGKKISMPLIISCMTGGFEGALGINRELALAAKSQHLPIGVGSVRAGLEDDKLRPTFSIVRKVAASVPIISNIGAQQLIGGGLEMAKRAVDMVSGDALAIHFNRVQEAIMPEGEMRMKGMRSALKRIVRGLRVPCIAKETGAGVSKEATRSFKEIGFKFVDVAGEGGTSFASIETRRAIEAGDEEKASLGRLYSDWGIPTAASIIEATSVPGVKIIGSGGITNGLDAARALVLGADYVAVARPILERVVKGGSASAISWIKGFSKEMKVAMLLVGADDISSLRRKPAVITGNLYAWAKLRKLDVERYSNR